MFDEKSFYRLIKAFEDEGQLDSLLDLFTQEELKSDRYSGGEKYLNEGDVRKYAKRLMDKYRGNPPPEEEGNFDEIKQAVAADKRGKVVKPKETWESATDQALKQAEAEYNLVKYIHGKLRDEQVKGLDLKEIDDDFIGNAIDRYYPKYSRRKKDIIGSVRRNMGVEENELQQIFSEYDPKTENENLETDSS